MLSRNFVRTSTEKCLRSRALFRLVNLSKGYIFPFRRRPIYSCRSAVSFATILKLLTHHQLLHDDQWSLTRSTHFAWHDTARMVPGASWSYHKLDPCVLYSLLLSYISRLLRTVISSLHVMGIHCWSSTLILNASVQHKCRTCMRFISSLFSFTSAQFLPLLTIGSIPLIASNLGHSLRDPCPC